MGYADSVVVSEIGGQKITTFTRNEEESRIGTIILRGSTKHLLDDAERAINNGVNLIKSTTKNNKFIPGAGAADIHLADKIQKYSKTVAGLDQYAIEKYGEALEVVPRTLAENAGHRAEELIAKLYKETEENSKMGIDVEEGRTHETDIYDNLETKTWAFKLATDAVLTVLKVDQIIMAKPAGGPDPNAGAKNMGQLDE
jgi:T-complex protein 1 subunit theta